MTTRTRIIPAIALGLAATLALSSPVFAAGQVHVVDPVGGPGVFLDVSQAVFAAVDGDTILVKGGGYNKLSIVGKSLTVIADGASVSFAAVSIGNISSSQSVTVRGCSVGGFGLFTNDLPVLIQGCQGAVVLEDLVVAQFLGSPDQTDHGVTIKSSDRVKLVRCSITAVTGTSGSNGLYGAQGGSGIYCTGSSVGIYDCVVTGGDGGDAAKLFVTLTSTFAGAGLWVSDGVVIASGSSFQGGQGGDGAETAPGLCDLPSSNSGDGISLFPNGQATLIDCVAFGGAAPAVPSGCPNAGQAGVAIETSPNGVLTVVNEPARSLEMSSPARGGQTATLEIDGAPNESTFLLFSANIHGALEPSVAGLLLPGAPIRVFGLAPLNASGKLLATLPIPPNALPPGIEAVDVYLQVAVPGSAGTGVMGSGTVVTLLAAGF